MNKKIATLLIVVAIVAGMTITTLFFSNQEETIDNRIQNLMEEGDIPSFAAGIILNDTMFWSKGYGEQSDVNTVYMIGSVTKMFTATAIMQLYDNNLLDLACMHGFLDQPLEAINWLSFSPSSINVSVGWLVGWIKI